jgi:hypothetical protein
VKFAVVARDPTIDLFLYDDLIGVEIVEAQDEQEAVRLSDYGDMTGYFVVACRVADDMDTGECSLGDIRHHEQS